MSLKKTGALNAEIAEGAEKTEGKCCPVPLRGTGRYKYNGTVNCKEPAVRRSGTGSAAQLQWRKGEFHAAEYLVLSCLRDF